MTTTINASTSSGLVVTPDNSGNVLLQYNGQSAPAFSAYSSNTSSLTNGAYTKVLYDTELFDTNNNFASSRFTPTVAGYYQLSGAVAFDGPVTSEVVLVLYKNGAAFHNFYDATISSNAYCFSGSCLVYANGSTDYFEIYCYQNSSRNAYGQAGATRYTWFNGCLLRGA